MIAVLISSAFAYAQFRTLPANARHAVTGEQLAMPYVTLNGKQAKLAPGAVIYDENNRSILQGNLPPHLHVVFNADMNGDVSRIYVLSATEWQQMEHKR